MLSVLYLRWIEMTRNQFILITAWHPLMWSEAKECGLFSPQHTVQQHKKERSFDCSEKYWLSAVLRCQMFLLKRVKGGRWACGQSLLPPLPVSLRGSNVDNLSSPFLIYRAKEHGAAVGTNAAYRCLYPAHYIHEYQYICAFCLPSFMAPVGAYLLASFSVWLQQKTPAWGSAGIWNPCER